MPSTKATSQKKSGNKTTPTKVSVSAFIDDIENETRKSDARHLLKLFRTVTKKKPVMWGPTIIGYGEYHYIYESGREGDMPIVGFSPRKANMVLYVMGSIDDDDPMLAKLGKYKNGKACLYINKLADIDLDILATLIEKSYNNTIAKWG